MFGIRRDAFLVVFLGLSALAATGLNAQGNSADSLAALRKAIASGSPANVALALDAGADVNGEFPELGQRYPLFLAVYLKKPEIVALLLQRGADPFKPCYSCDYPREFSALNLAVNWGSPEVVRTLLDRVDFPAKSLATAARMAVYLPLDTMRVLLEHPDTAAPAVREEILLAATYEGAQRRLDVLTYLVSIGADPDGHAKDGIAPLMGAVSLGPIENVRYLMGTGRVNVNRVTQYGETALRRAAAGGRVEIVEALVGAGADVEHVDPRDGATPLLAASESPSVTRFLLSAGADFRRTDKDGRTGMIRAVALSSRREFKPHEVLAAYREAGADPNTRDRERGFTALHYAAHAGDFESLELLAEAVDGIDQRSAAVTDAQGRTHPGGQTALMIAALDGRPALVAFLLAEGADPSAVDDSGHAVLDYAKGAKGIVVGGYPAYPHSDPAVERLISQAIRRRGRVTESVTLERLLTQGAELRW